jgi:class 3 adenylate cyclase/CHASE2 domain-containing sensor protein
VKLKPVKLAPALIALCVLLLVGLLRLLQPDFLERPELMTFDWRVREALKFAPPVTTNLGFVYISDQTIDALSKGLLGKSYGLYWPRQIYGHLIRELSAQKVKSVGFDIILAELRPDHSPVPVSMSQWPEAMEFLSALHPKETAVTYENQGEKMILMESDDYFAWQLRRAKAGILAAEKGVQPNRLFATNALAVADISANRDPDGVLRRVKAFQVYTNWHRLFQQVENDPTYGVNLQKATIEGTNLVLLRPEGLDPIRVPLDADNNFELSAFLGDEIPAGWPKKDKVFSQERVWHIGIVLAAQELNLDLANAEVDLPRGRITLRGPNGFQRILPVDEEGYFYINWEIPYGSLSVSKEPMEDLLMQDIARSAGKTNGLANRWENKLAIVGSRTVGNDLTDHGATPLERDTLLVSEHWNVANSILTGRFIRQSSVATDLLLIAIMGIAAGWLTWQMRALTASLCVALLIAGYIALGFVLYVRHRFWMPLVLPVFGALFTHICLVTWRVVFEQAERRRVKSIFSKIVAPNIVNELLGAEKLSLGGARREVTVLFADVRGFTEFTDKSQEQAVAYVVANKLTGEAMEAYFNEQARETLATINLYLGVVADIIIKQDGTLDKFIGDCVMAFWGAPTPSPRHALACVRAAIGAQQAIYELNRQRADYNKKLESENLARASAGLPQKSVLPILLLGSGINTGMATVGLMGSKDEQKNYTVFGRDVNLASRLETVSGRGRIVISEATYEHVRRDDPALAATCVALAPEKVKGFRMAVKVCEVPWRLPGSISLDEEFFPQKTADKSPETILIQHQKT